MVDDVTTPLIINTCYNLFNGQYSNTLAITKRYLW